MATVMERNTREGAMSPIKIILGCVLFDALQLIVSVVLMESASVHLGKKLIETKGDHHEDNDSSENFDSAPRSGARILSGSPLPRASRSGSRFLRRSQPRGRHSSFPGGRDKARASRPAIPRQLYAAL